MDHGKWVSRRRAIEVSGRMVLGITLAVAHSTVLTGCGSGAGQPQDDPVPPLSPVSGGEFVAIVGEGSRLYVNRDTGQVVQDCPTLAFPQRLQVGDDISFEMSFQGADQSAVAGCSVSDYQFPAGFTLPPLPSPSAGSVNLTREPGYVYKDFGFFVLKMGRVEEHKFSPCVEQPVWHTHVYVKKDRSVKDQDSTLVFHVGTYRDGNRSCFAVYESKRKAVCAKVCIDDDGNLYQKTYRVMKEMWAEALRKSLLAAGVVVAAWLITAAAEVLAGLTVGVLLAL